MSSTQIQLLGHATFKVKTPQGKTILIDPWIINNPYIPEQFRNFDKIDLILITHGHEDHCDPQLRELVNKYNPTIIANNVVRWFFITEKGFSEDIFEPMNLGGSINIMDLRVTMVNAFHLSHLQISDDKIGFTHQAIGFIIKFSDGFTIYFAGDTALFSDMKMIGDIYKPTIAILPIGDRFTMGPLEAAYAIRLLRVKHVIPFHYGTYTSLTGTPEELIELTKDIEDLNVHVLKAGETLQLDT